MKLHGSHCLKDCSRSFDDVNIIANVLNVVYVITDRLQCQTAFAYEERAKDLGRSSYIIISLMERQNELTCTQRDRSADKPSEQPSDWMF